MRFFITGTDTGVGKTTVAAALIHSLRSTGVAARAIKPIETGWNESTSDARLLATASQAALESSVWMHFDLPRSPSAAARAEGRSIDVDALAIWCAAQVADPLLIEGAGGWMVPIQRDVRMRDLAVRVADTVIVVARAGLGTINHSILTAEAVAATHHLTGIVLCRRPEDDLAFARDNAREIAEQTAVRVAIYPDDCASILAWLSVRKPDIIAGER
jgi:dethiobiotin synthetase